MQRIIAVIYILLAGFSFYFMVKWPTIGGRLFACLTSVAALYGAYSSIRQR